MPPDPTHDTLPPSTAAQRKDAVKLLRQGVVTMTAEQKEQLKTEFAALKVDELLAPHPQYAQYFAAQGALAAELEREERELAGGGGAGGALQGSGGAAQSGKTQAPGRSAGGKHPVAAACLSLAVPLTPDLLARLGKGSQ